MARETQDQVLTWKTMHNPAAMMTGSTASIPAAAALFNAGFGNFRDVGNSFIEQDTANWENAKRNNTNEALQAIMDAQNPEDMVAKRAQVMDILKNAQAQVDSQAVLSALDKRAPELQQRALNDIKFKEAKVDAEVRPLVEQFKSAIASGDILTANILQNALNEKGRGGDVAIQGVEFLDKRASNESKLKTEASQRQLTEAQIKEIPARIAAHATQAKASLITAISKLEEDNSTSASNTAKTLKALQDSFTTFKDTKTAFGSGSLDSKEGWDNFTEYVRKNVEGQDNQDAVLSRFSEIVSSKGNVRSDADGNPIYVPMPVKGAIDAVNGHLKDWVALGKRSSNQYRQYLYDNFDTLAAEKKAIKQFEDRLIEAGATLGTSTSTPKSSGREQLIQSLYGQVGINPKKGKGN